MGEEENKLRISARMINESMQDLKPYYTPRSANDPKKKSIEK